MDLKPPASPRPLPEAAQASAASANAAPGKRPDAEKDYRA